MTTDRPCPRLRRSAAVLICVLLIGPTLLILVLAHVAPTTTALMLIRMMQGQAPKRTWVPFESIAPVMRRAVIAGEDIEFCHEPIGIDLAAIGRQAQVWLAGGRPTGASTIAMQTARNLFLWPQRSWLRKGLEMWLAPQLSLFWPRRRLLEVYLNVAEFGPGVYGVEAAAGIYFDKSAAALTAEEASELTVRLPSPSQAELAMESARTRDRREWIRSFIDLADDSFSCAG